jgi:vancomycin resistance protein YoaR
VPVKQEQFGGATENTIMAVQPISGASDWGVSDSRSNDSSTEPQTQGRLPGGRSLKPWLILAATLVVLATFGAGVLYYLDQQFAGKIYPNISVRGIDIGQMSEADAKAAITSHYDSFLARPVTLKYGEKVWTPSASELGVSLNVDRAVQIAYEAGRGNGFLQDMWDVAAIWREGIELPLHVTVDQTAMQSYLAKLASDVERPARDAQLIFQGTSLGTQPSQTGVQFLLDETTLDLTAALQDLDAQEVSLRTSEVAAVLGDADVIHAQREIEQIIRAPVQIDVEGKPYSWSVDELVELVQVQKVDGAITVSINEEPIKQRLAAIAASTGTQPTHPRVDWNGGNLKIVSPGQKGYQLDQEASLPLVLAAMTGSDRTASLPFTEVDSPVRPETLGQLGIKELISVGRSDYTGSASYRITNIGVGMKLLDNILLAPGEEFSFNDTVGEIDEANGFVEGYAIVQNRTQLEFGGGICQDSTTMYRAAFWAGVPITEWKEHRYYISWYDKYAYPDASGPGMDATIYTGAQDFKFVNDTGNWMLIQASADHARHLAEIRLYGTKPNRTVDIDWSIVRRIPAPTEPRYVPDPEIPVGARKQTDTARGGMVVEVYRLITENGVARKPELFRSSFQAWPDIFLVNPASLGPDGKPIQAPKPEETPEEGQPPADGQQPPADGQQPPADGQQPPAEQPQPPVEQPQPPVEQPQPPVEQPPVEQPQPPAEQPPASE